MARRLLILLGLFFVFSISARAQWLHGITLLQSSTYLVTGIPSALFSALEGLPDSLIVNAVTVLSMLLMLLGYVFLKPTKFKIEIITLTALVYLQAYFWFTIMRIVVI